MIVLQVLVCGGLALVAVSLFLGMVQEADKKAGRKNRLNSQIAAYGIFFLFLGLICAVWRLLG